MEERKRKKRKKEEEQEEEEKKKNPFSALPYDMILYEILIHVEILFKVPMEISKKSVIKKTNFYFARDKHHENRRRYRFNNIIIKGYSMTRIEFKEILRYISPKIKFLSLYNCPFIVNFLYKFALNKMDKIIINEINTQLPRTIILFKKDLFKKVKRIHLEDIRMNKLTGFKGATQLESIVLKSSNCTPIIPMIYDISGIKDCYNLKKINLSGITIDVFPYFQNFNKIIVIKIDRCKDLIHISGLENLTNLRELVIYSCRKIVSYDSLSKLVNLVNLRIWHCSIENIDFVKPLNELKFLYLVDNNLTDITPLKDLKKLKNLNLSINKLTDITPLKDLKKLKFLYLYKNKLTDITPLKDLKKLNNLNLSKNKLTDITPLKELTLLSILTLSYNDINDISSLERLINMKELKLDSNKIIKFKVGIQHMTKLQILYMGGNTTTESMKFILDKKIFKKLINVWFPRVLTLKWTFSEELDKYQEKWTYSPHFNSNINKKFYES